MRNFLPNSNHFLWLTTFWITLPLPKSLRTFHFSNRAFLQVNWTLIMKYSQWSRMSICFQFTIEKSSNLSGKTFKRHLKSLLQTWQHQSKYAAAWKLPDDYQAVYEWSMSRKLKNLSTLDVHLNFPYGTFCSSNAPRTSIRNSHGCNKFSAQFGENFTLARRHWFLISFLNAKLNSSLKSRISRHLDSDLYQVYRVIDPQDFIHKARALPRDEPTHHINVLIHDAVSQLTPEERADLRFDDPTVRKTLSIGITRRPSSWHPWRFINWPLRKNWTFWSFCWWDEATGRFQSFWLPSFSIKIKA